MVPLRVRVGSIFGQGLVVMRNKILCSAEWVEARISISSARNQELQNVILGRFGLQSIKEPSNGYLVPIPSLNDSRRKFLSASPSDSVGDGCDTFKNFKILSWRPRSKRKRGNSLP